MVAPRPTEGEGRFLYKTYGTKLKVKMAADAQLILHGDVSLQSDLGDQGLVDIRIGASAKLEFKGPFTIGAGTKIQVAPGARLVFHGQKDSSGSGITSNTRIMVKESMEIGADCIVAWDVFLTDCDWHQIGDNRPSAPVKIGNRTWIARGASILKGSTIACDSIIACGAVVTGKTFPAQSLIAGNPARVVRQNVFWSREMAKNADG